MLRLDVDMEALALNWNKYQIKLVLELKLNTKINVWM
jgi:hypothetical protein